MSKINASAFLKGVGVGLVTGMAVSVCMTPPKRKRDLRCSAAKTLRSISAAVENLF